MPISLSPIEPATVDSTPEHVTQQMRTRYPRTSALVDDETWHAVAAALAGGEPEDLQSQILELQSGRTGLPGYLADLARLERALHDTRTAPLPDPASVARLTVNPTLQLVPTSWTGLIRVLHAETAVPPQPGEELLLLWRSPGDGRLGMRGATDSDLLALKLVTEDLDPLQVATAEQAPPGLLDQALRRAAAEGILLAPPPDLRRDPARYPPWAGIDPGYSEVSTFTLQWHVTHACDLHCRHCYDRSHRSDLTLEQGLRLLDDLYRFCQDRQVAGQVSFTGGNPLLFPAFDALYRAAIERGFLASILGNPAPRERITALAEIGRPDVYQVSLEGLREHNDHIRGAGHFDRVLEFLPVLRELGIHSMVMLTLTRSNQDQVLPLAALLRDRADTFHFNRLSPVGEGAQLQVAAQGSFEGFLVEVLEASRDNPILGLKDNLFNRVLWERGLDLFGGCTGHGCGAAFNFLSVLPDGETHACRKFPSAIGNVLEQGIAAVYDSPAGARYRAGTEACRACSLATVCGGCMASTSGAGLDPFQDRDPYCEGPVTGRV